MSESKTYVFGNDSNNGILSLVAPLLQQRGVDPNVLATLMNNRGGIGGEGSWFMWIFFLFFLMGWRGNGFGNNGCGDSNIGSMINDNTGRELLMQAIQGNSNAIQQLSSTLGCSVAQVQQAINSLGIQLQNVGNQVGQSAMEIINAIQAGNCSIASKLADCCCENRLAICQQTNTLQSAINGVSVGQERGFSSLAFETQKQTCDLSKVISDSTEKILSGQRAAEMREMQREITERDRKIAEQAVVINNAQQTAVVGQIVQQATTPLYNAVNALQKDVDCVKCKLPETTTIPYSPVVGVPTCVAAQYGLGLGLGNFGLWG